MNVRLHTFFVKIFLFHSNHNSFNRSRINFILLLEKIYVLIFCKRHLSNSSVLKITGFLQVFDKCEIITSQKLVNHFTSPVSIGEVCYNECFTQEPVLSGKDCWFLVAILGIQYAFQRVTQHFIAVSISVVHVLIHAVIK